MPLLPCLSKYYIDTKDKTSIVYSPTLNKTSHATTTILDLTSHATSTILDLTSHATTTILDLTSHSGLNIHPIPLLPGLSKYYKDTKDKTFHAHSPNLNKTPHHHLYHPMPKLPSRTKHTMRVLPQNSRYLKNIRYHLYYPGKHQVLYLPSCKTSHAISTILDQHSSYPNSPILDKTLYAILTILDQHSSYPNSLILDKTSHSILTILEQH